MKLIRDTHQRGVREGKVRIEDGFVFGEDRVEVRVLGDALERDVWNPLVPETACDAAGFVLKPKVFVLGR